MVPTSDEYGCTPDKYGSIYLWKIMVLLLKSHSEEFHENSIFTRKEFHIVYSTFKKILSLCNLPLKISICPQPFAGGMDIKCNSPIIPRSW